MNFEADFPQVKLFKERGLVYLDSAATALKPQVVIDSLSEFYSTSVANAHRGAHELGRVVTGRYEEVREVVAKFINASKPEEIIFSRSTTDAINFIATSLGSIHLVKEGDVVVVTEVEHHSNYLPWKNLCEKLGAQLKVIPRQGSRIDLDELKRVCETEPVKVFAMPLVSNVLGVINPVQEWINIARASNPDVISVVDGAQAMSSVPVDVQAMGCDFFAFSGHKFYGPTGASAFYVSSKYLDQLEPYQYGGGIVSRVTRDSVSLAPPPQKFEAGTPSVAEVLAFGKAISYFSNLDFEKVKEHTQGLMFLAYDLLSQCPGVKLLVVDKSDLTSLVSFVVNEAHYSDISQLLSDQGVYVSGGHVCAGVLMDSFGVPGVLRISASVYNSQEDIEKAVAALRKALDILGVEDE